MLWNDIFDYKDGILYWKVSHKNNIVKKGDSVGTTLRTGYPKFGYKYKTYSVHRVIWEMHNGPISAGKLIDHINGIKTDNRIENLRLVNHSQNNRNRAIHRGSEVVGSHYVKYTNKWRATINLGSFDSKEESDALLKLVKSLLREKLCVQF